MNQILSMNDDSQKNKNLQNNNQNRVIPSQTNEIVNNNEMMRNFENNNFTNPANQYNNVNNISQNETINRANLTSNKADISKVIKVFCIIIILFGFVLIGESTYAMLANRKKDEDNPKVYPLQMGKETKITVETEHPIKEFSYKWNEGEEVKIAGNGTILFETVIQIPNGNNILNMTVTDYNGNKQKFHRQYIYDSTDVNKPTIDIAVSGTNLKITATDDIEMSYVTYSWNGEEAIRIDKDEYDEKVIEVEIEVPEGQNKLTIIAVDEQENRETRTESVIGDTKPEFDLLKEGNNLVVKANDDQGISRISIDVDGNVTDSGEDPINMKEVTATLPLEAGTHEIKVTVTNINGLSDTKNVTADF